MTEKEYLEECVELLARSERNLKGTRKNMIASVLLMLATLGLLVTIVSVSL